MHKLNILIFSNIPAPYFVDYCEELSQYVSLTVAFELREATNRNKKWYKESESFKTIFLDAKRLSNESGLSFRYKMILKQNRYDLVIVGNPTTFTGIFLTRYLKKHKIPFAIQSEGGFLGSGKGFKEKIKKRIISGANFYLSGMSGDSCYFKMYAHKGAKIYHYHFASYRDALIDKKMISLEEKENYKKAFGIDRSIVVCYVGHFILEKGYKLALDMAKRFKKNKNVVFCFAGGKPSSDDEKFIKDNSLDNIKYVGFLNQKELSALYHASSLLILPTYSDTWGLVINEAMANGLPVVTTNMCIAGLELLKKNHPECIANVGDSDDLYNKVLYLVENESALKDLSQYGLKIIQKHSIENMASEIYSYIKEETYVS